MTTLPLNFQFLFQQFQVPFQPGRIDADERLSVLWQFLPGRHRFLGYKARRLVIIALVWQGSEQRAADPDMGIRPNDQDLRANVTPLLHQVLELDAQSVGVLPMALHEIIGFLLLGRVGAAAVDVVAQTAGGSLQIVDVAAQTFQKNGLFQVKGVGLGRGQAGQLLLVLAAVDQILVRLEIAIKRAAIRAEAQLLFFEIDLRADGRQDDQLGRRFGQGLVILRRLVFSI